MMIALAVGLVLCLAGLLYIVGEFMGLKHRIERMEALAGPIAVEAEARVRDTNRSLDHEARTARMEQRLDAIEQGPNASTKAARGTTRARKK